MKHRDDNDLPLIAAIEAKEAARNRAELGATRAAAKAERVEPGWQASAVEAIRKFASTHRYFVIEAVRAEYPTPEGASAKAWGHVVREAVRLGYVRKHGYAPTASSNGSPKVLWESTVLT